MKTAEKLTAVLLALLAILSLGACSRDKSPAVMTLDGATVTKNMFTYWTCSYKGMFMSTYSDMNDTDEFWNSTLQSGLTAEEFLGELVVSYVKNDLAAIYLFDRFGMKISNEDRQKAEEIVSDLCESWADGSKNNFNRLIAQYGVNYDTLIDMYLADYKMTYVYNYVFENGVIAVGDEEKQTYLEDNYAHIRHIYINDAYDPDKSYYDSDGNYVMEKLDSEAQAKKDKKTADVKALLDSGADFDAVYSEYSEETAYPNGYYISGETEGVPSELIQNSLEMEVGEVRTFETQYGTHIIKKLEMEKGAYSDEKNSDFFGDFSDQVYEDVFAKYLKSFHEKISVDETVLSEVSIREAIPNYAFQY